VHKLDRDSCRERRLAARRRREEEEQRTEPLAAGCERLDADLGDEARARRDRLGKTLLEVLEVGVEPGRGSNRCDRAQRAAPVWRATMPYAKRRQRISSKPASSRSFARPSGAGNRRTLAGRYE